MVSDPERPGKKIRVSQLILQISIRDLHNDLISESSIHQLKEAIDKKTGKTLISDTALRALMSKNVLKITYRYKQMCDCKICVIICYAIITKSLPAAGSKPIQITRTINNINNKTQTIMCLCCHLMKRNKKSTRLKMSMIKNEIRITRKI